MALGSLSWGCINRVPSNPTAVGFLEPPWRDGAFSLGGCGPTAAGLCS